LRIDLGDNSPEILDVFALEEIDGRVEVLGQGAFVNERMKTSDATDEPLAQTILAPRV